MSKHQSGAKNKGDDKAKATKSPSSKPGPPLTQQASEKRLTTARPNLLQKAIADPAHAEPSTLQTMQRAYGNQFVQRLATNIQPKLTVNQPDDQFEQEAETMAQSLPTNGTQHAPPSGDGAPNGNQAQRKKERGNGRGKDHPTAPGTQKANKPATNQQAGISRQRTNTPPDDSLEPDADTLAEGSSLPGTEHVPNIGVTDVAASVQRRLATAVSDTTSLSAANPKTPPVPTRLNLQTGTSQPKVKPPQIQRRLTINEPDDQFEQEADEMANGLQLMPEHLPPISRADEPGADTDGAIHTEVENQIDRARGGGESLPDNARGQMESHFNNDFSHVRVHHDAQSDTLNRSLNARAFTTGNDVFFRQDEYEPGSSGGQQLIAHELTHVVQQKGSKPLRRKKEEAVSEEVEPGTMVQAKGGCTCGGTCASCNGEHEEEQAMRAKAPDTAVQREDDDEAKKKEEAEKEAEKGKEKANEEKAAKENEQKAKEEEAKEKLKQGQKEKGAGAKEKKEDKGLAIPEAEPAAEVQNPGQRMDPDALELPEVPGLDMERLGWPGTKEESLPDWDNEVAKYDSFVEGDYESLGVDLSKLENDTSGIEVDEDTRKQMVADALAEGALAGAVDGGISVLTGAALGAIAKKFPMAGAFFTTAMVAMDPKKWAESTFGGIKNKAGEIGSSFAGLGEGSGWNRAASFFEGIIAILELVDQVIQLVLTILSILLVITYLFCLMTSIPIVGAAFAWACPIPPALQPIVTTLGQISLIIQFVILVLRPLVIIFRVIDMLYYESDPEKLMEKQAKLKGQMQAFTSGAVQSTARGLGGRKKKQPKGADGDQPKVSNTSGKAENAAGGGGGTFGKMKQKALATKEANLKSFGGGARGGKWNSYFQNQQQKWSARSGKIESKFGFVPGVKPNPLSANISHGNRGHKAAQQIHTGGQKYGSFTGNISSADMAEDRDAYKAQFLDRYGIQDNADWSADYLADKLADLPAPPIIPYVGEKEDVEDRVNRNAMALAYLHLEYEELAAQQGETQEAQQVGKDQINTFKNTRGVLAANQKAVQLHQKEAEYKMEKQGQLREQTELAEKTASEGKEKGSQGDLMMKIIMPIIMAFMGTAKKETGGKGADPNKASQGMDKQVQGSQTGVDAAKKGTRQADEWKQQSKQTLVEAKQSEQEMVKLDEFLTGNEEEAETGLGELEEHQGTIEEQMTALEEEKQRLIEERTEAVNEGVSWMEDWVTTRKEIFAELEAKLEDKGVGEDDEDAEEDKFDVYDEKEDKLEGEYFGIEGEDEFEVI